MLQLIWKWPSSPDEQNHAHTQNFSPIGATTAEIRQILKVFPRCASDGTRWPGAEIAFLGSPQVWSIARIYRNPYFFFKRVHIPLGPQCEGGVPGWVGVVVGVHHEIVIQDLVELDHRNLYHVCRNITRPSNSCLVSWPFGVTVHGGGCGQYPQSVPSMSTWSLKRH